MVIIETHTQIDSRFVLYNLAYLLSRLDPVLIYTNNPNFKKFDGSQDISVEYVNDFLEEKDINHDFEYILLDNNIAFRSDVIIYFIDPYSELDLTSIPRDAHIIRVFKGEGRKYQPIKDRTLCSEEDLALENVMHSKMITNLPSYEDIFKFENIRHFIKMDPNTQKIYTGIKELFPRGLNPMKGVPNEYTNSLRVKVLW